MYLKNYKTLIIMSVLSLAMLLSACGDAEYSESDATITDANNFIVSQDDSNADSSITAENPTNSSSTSSSANDTNGIVTPNIVPPAGEATPAPGEFGSSHAPQDWSIPEGQILKIGEKTEKAEMWPLEFDATVTTQDPENPSLSIEHVNSGITHSLEGFERENFLIDERSRNPYHVLTSENVFADDNTLLPSAINAEYHESENPVFVYITFKVTNTSDEDGICILQNELLIVDKNTMIADDTLLSPMPDFLYLDCDIPFGHNDSAAVVLTPQQSATITMGYAISSNVLTDDTFLLYDISPAATWFVYEYGRYIAWFLEVKDER